jgi:negative regulator of flagellin synthesis FlgM
MKIDKNNQQLKLWQSPSTLPSSKADNAQTTTQGSGATDKVELSGWKNVVAGLKEQMKSIPVVDEDKVARMKQAIESGTYSPDGTSVARSMLKGQFLDQIG